MTDGILLTGATGFLGGEVLARYLDESERTVYALVRAGNQEQAEARIREVIGGRFGDEHAHAGRVVAVAGDVTEEGLGLDDARRNALAEAVTDVVHCAASVSFSLPIGASRRINVGGTANVLELALRCAERGDGLRRFSHVSTAYVSGDIESEFAETDLDVGQQFRNPYERSKFEAEALVGTYASQLPVQVFRPSIVVGDSGSGWTSAFNVLYWPLRAYSRGLYTTIPARRPSPVDVVPVNYVADAIAELTLRPRKKGATYHVTAGEDASSVGELLDMAGAYFEMAPPRVVSPRVFQRMIRPALVASGGLPRLRQLQKIEPFFPYFSMRVRFGNEATRVVLDPLGIRVPRLEDYFGRLLDFAVACNWGRDSYHPNNAVRQEGHRGARVRALRAGERRRPEPAADDRAAERISA